MKKNSKILMVYLFVIFFMPLVYGVAAAFSSDLEELLLLPQVVSGLHPEHPAYELFDGQESDVMTLNDLFKEVEGSESLVVRILRTPASQDSQDSIRTIPHGELYGPLMRHGGVQDRLVVVIPDPAGVLRQGVTQNEESEPSCWYHCLTKCIKAHFKNSSLCCYYVFLAGVVVFFVYITS